MIRFRYFGDSEKAKELVHFGRKQMNILREQLSLSTIWTDVRRFFDKRSGIEIICSIVSGMEQVDIYVPLRVVPVAVKKEELEELEYKVFLVVSAGRYLGTADNEIYNSAVSKWEYSFIWDVENECVVRGPCSYNEADTFFQGRNFDSSSTRDYFFRVLAFNGSSIAVFNATALAANEELDCTLKLPYGYGEFNCSDASGNAVGGTDTCSMHYESSFTSSSPIADCLNPNARDYVSDYKAERNEYYMLGIARNSDWAPTVLVGTDGSSLSSRVTSLGSSVALGNNDGYVVAGTSYSLEWSYKNYVYWKNDCVGSLYKETTNQRETYSMHKNFSIATPMGRLFSEEGIDYDVCNYIATDTSSIGSFIDIAGTSSKYEATYVESPGMVDNPFTKVAFYFSQYNTYGGTEAGGNTCNDYMAAAANVDLWRYAVEHNLINFGERTYDVIAGTTTDSVKGTGVDIDKSEKLTQAFRDLIDYYYANILVDGEHVDSAYIDDRLDINISLLSAEKLSTDDNACEEDEED